MWIFSWWIYIILGKAVDRNAIFAGVPTLNRNKGRVLFTISRDVGKFWISLILKAGNKIIEAVARVCFVKKVFLKILYQAYNFNKKESLALVFYCDFPRTLRNILLQNNSEGMHLELGSANFFHSNLKSIYYDKRLEFT